MNEYALVIKNAKLEYITTLAVGTENVWHFFYLQKSNRVNTII